MNPRAFRVGARRPLLGLSPEEKRKFDKLYKAVKSAKLTKLAA